MDGCHGNKGVISRLLPDRGSSVPEDGDAESTSCSTRWACRRRMNVGQILEVHLGLGRGEASVTQIHAYMETHPSIDVLQV